MSDLANILERFRRGGELLAMSTTGAAGSELDFKPAADKWCVRQIVCHLADSEVVGVMRIRQMAAEENPTLQAFNGELWADHLDYGRRKISQALEIFRKLRAENHELLKALPEDAFARTGVHTESGPLTLLDLVKGNAEHVEEHVQQIQRTRAAYREHRAKQTAQAPVQS
jgi:DinB superfamily